VIGWLRREARKGPVMGGLCTAGYTLAGRAAGRQARDDPLGKPGQFRRGIRRGELTKSVFVIDGNRITTAGGTASIDLMLKIIADDHGEDLANAVADQLIYTSIRTDQDTQRLSIPTRIGVRHPKLGQVIQMMEQNIEEPISPAQLAKDVGMSTRQLERLFRRYLNRSPSATTWNCGCSQGAQPADADRHERDQRGAGLRLRLALAFLEMLPRALRHHALPRARQPTRVKLARQVGIAVEGHIDRNLAAIGPLVPQDAGVDVAVPVQ
jgi:AraC-like DNA-binding protein